MNDKAFKLGFLKEAASIEEPLPQKFLEQVIKLPPKERQKAVQTKLKEWMQKLQQNIMSNINDVKLGIKEDKMEKIKKKREKMKEGK